MIVFVTHKENPKSMYICQPVGECSDGFYAKIIWSYNAEYESFGFFETDRWKIRNLTEDEIAEHFVNLL